MLFQRMQQTLEQIEGQIYRNAHNSEVNTDKVNINNFINMKDTLQKAALNYLFKSIGAINENYTIGVNNNYQVYLIVQIKKVISNNGNLRPLTWLELNKIIDLAAAQEFNQLSHSFNDQLTWNKPYQTSLGAIGDIEQIFK